MKSLRAMSYLLVLASAAVCLSCSKPALYGTIQESSEVVKTYNVPPQEAFRAAKEALVFHGYSLKQDDEKNFVLETYWQPTTADSHYVSIFGRKDFGTVGAYYRLVVKITPQGDGARVGITNVAKSFISNLKSSRQEEERVFEKISDFTRKQDIQVTNIGLQ